MTSKFLFVSMDDKEKVGKPSETDSIKPKISSKTSHGKKDSKKRQNLSKNWSTLKKKNLLLHEGRQK